MNKTNCLKLAAIFGWKQFDKVKFKNWDFYPNSHI